MMQPNSPIHVGDATPFVVEALIVGGDEDWLFVVLSPYYLEVARSSVLAVEELPTPSTVHAGRAIAVALTLRPGAVLRALRSSHELEPIVRRQCRSFLTTSRPAPVEVPTGSPSLEAKTSEFLARFGIAVDRESP